MFKSLENSDSSLFSLNRAINELEQTMTTVARQEVAEDTLTPKDTPLVEFSDCEISYLGF